jgi:hypothetical protein
MPREMHSFDGTRWTSTSSAATLKAPHGGMAALEVGLTGCGGNCGCASCGTSSRRFALRPLNGLGGNIGSGKTTAIETPSYVTGSDGFLGAKVEPVSSGGKQGVQAEVYVFGQPPLDVRGTVERANQAMGELGMPEAKITAKSFPLQWSWAYDGQEKSWTAYVSNADAGPFLRLLNVKRAYRKQSDTPVADDIKDLPTTGAVVQALGEFPRAMTLSEQTRVINTFKPFRPLGTDLFFALRFYDIPSSRGWLWGVLALGGLAYARSKL